MKGEHTYTRKDIDTEEEYTEGFTYKMDTDDREETYTWRHIQTEGPAHGGDTHEEDTRGEDTHGGDTHGGDAHNMEGTNTLMGQTN